MVPRYSCYIYGTWKEQSGWKGRGFKVIIWGEQATKSGPNFYGES